MFRITRGMHVQHIHFPLPVLGARDLDLDDDAEASPDADEPPAEPASAKAREEPAGDSAG